MASKNNSCLLLINSFAARRASHVSIFSLFRVLVLLKFNFEGILSAAADAAFINLRRILNGLFFMVWLISKNEIPNFWKFRNASPVRMSDVNRSRSNL